MDSQTVAIVIFATTLGLIVLYVVAKRFMASSELSGRDDTFHKDIQTRPTFGVPMIHVVTTLILLTSLWIIVSNKYDADTKKWAFASSSSVVSFWLGSALPKED